MVSSRSCLWLQAASLTLLSVNLHSTSAFTIGPETTSILTNDVAPSSISRRPQYTTLTTLQQQQRITSKPQPHTILSLSDNNNNDPSTIPKKTKPASSQLLAESIAPWRTLRLFLYTSLGAGASLGGFITLTSTLAALSGARPDLELSTQYTNLAIDFGAVALFVVAGKLDWDKGRILDEKVEEKIQKAKDNRGVKKGMKEREAALGSLEVELRVDEEGGMQRAMVSAVQSGAKQHVIIVAGPRKVIRDALLGANLLKMEFAMRDVLVVPYELGGKKNKKNKEEEDKLSKPDGRGFDTNKRPTWETQPYVADAIGDDWETYINAEMEDAVTQNGPKVQEDGIVIIVANTGEIIRRGVGQVPWRNIVEELEQKVKEDNPINLGFLSES